MENIIIVIILLIVFVLAIKGSIKHFRGEGGCCGGSTKVPKKRLNGKIIKTYILTIEGMHCQNCANNVERAVNRIDGAVAKVNLRKGIAKVSCDKEIDIELIKAAIEERGYKAY